MVEFGKKWSDRRTARPSRQTAGAPVSIPTPSGGVVLVDPREHRGEVVRRLLSLGVSCETLLTLLPGWAALIHSATAGHDGHGADDRLRPRA